VKVGDPIWVNNRPTGSLTLKHILPGRNLYMIATGTGLAPFISLIRSPETYDAFERIILIHTVRTVKELVYKEELESRSGERLLYVPAVTREDFKINKRGTDLFRSGELFDLYKLPLPDPEQDRIMLCGNPDMNREMTDYLKENGWTSTSHRGIGNLTVEKAFVFQK
jgi:ferredoxin--NADP+ reductase